MTEQAEFTFGGGQGKQVRLRPARKKSAKRTGGKKKGGSEGGESRVTAETLAGRQREISVSEFFTKNRHLLGFDNPAKALLTTVKEAVDNSLDACEEAHIVPEVVVEIQEISDTRYKVVVEDNGPGIVRNQVPKIFAKLLYGSKFHRLRQSRGQQGIGISAAGLYGQLTTGKPMIITSRTGKRSKAHVIHVQIDTTKNKPKILKDEVVEDWHRDHGTRVEIELTGKHRGGRTGVDAYVEQTVVANPHVSFTYRPPKGDEQIFERATDELPREPAEIKPHPHGVELGMLMRMLHDARGLKVKGALSASFSRVSAATAEKVCQAAGVPSSTSATSATGEQIEALHQALGETKVMAPPSSCVVPIGEDLVIAGLQRRYQAEFFEATTRSPAVYRGNPFVVECGLAYGGDLPLDEPAEILRFANRVPLQYQPKACAISESVYSTNWKAYTLSQPKGSLPVAPLAIFVHLASVWVPFTSEAKEAVAHYDEILREIRFALQECGRKLAAKLRARERAESEAKRRGLFERYIPELGASLGNITGRSAKSVEKLFFAALPQFIRIAEIAEAAAEAHDVAKPAGKKAPARASGGKKAGKRAPAQKAGAKKSSAKKASARKAPTKKASAKKAAARKATAKKAPKRGSAKKATSRKAPAKKAPARPKKTTKKKAKRR